jgi:hypothetical protein
MQQTFRGMKMPGTSRRTERSGQIDNGASDHPLAWADVRVQ